LSRLLAPPDGAVPDLLEEAELPPATSVERVRAAVADRLPVTLRAAVWAPAGRAVVGVAVLALVAVVTAVVVTWLARPQEAPVPPRRSSGPAETGPATTVAALSTPTAAASAAPAETLLVHVAGAVRRPGLVDLPAGSRVADAVDAAGGLTARAVPASVNLARPVVDGEQVVVLARDDPGADLAAGIGAPQPVPAPPGSGAAAGVPVDLNRATLADLDALPGIGPVLAQRILDWRQANGRFSAVEELGEVKGIGDATLAELRPAVVV
jgi:competence protein ComEA